MEVKVDPRSVSRALVLAAFLAASLLAALAIGTAVASAATLYVGDSKDYSVAFRAEEDRLYVLELAGTVDCYYNEPHMDAGRAGFSSFAAPKLLVPNSGSEDPRPTAEDSRGFLHGAGTGQVWAELTGGSVTGSYAYGTSEESFHCDTGFPLGKLPFETARYEPIGSPGTAAPAGGELGVYYGNEGPVEVFLRTPKGAVGGLRGTFVSECQVEGGHRGSRRRSLFSLPAGAKQSADGEFRSSAKIAGKLRHGATYAETMTISGRVEAGAVTGTYKRVRTAKPKRGRARRCVTGPLPFSAVRYLPAD